ncbi:DNA repair protein RecO [Myroides pelagicus]|uniref:DNA repair protein RecO n=1 Tax=Myroides pelagicus TaxID=270914 RepID=A0A7K1GK66_9FLAO|nr:DNA repair protein RecO [Myroides pelagicus]MEC4112911.1 DNA repair protein RecO [Myroides pelagicus]MTH28909.1 DNA repair protein RecO [Myroides pelagicus]
MLIKTKAIVLSALKYQEKSLVVRCLTREVGVQTFFVRNAFAKGKSAQKNVYFQPLTNLDIEFLHKNKGGMEYLKEVRVGFIYQDIYYDFVKNSIAIFISEVLHNIVSEQERDEQLFDFIEVALLWLDTHQETANFHLILMKELTKYFGFYPDTTEDKQYFFNWVEGEFSATFDNRCFDAEETYLFKKLLDLGFEDNQHVFTGRDRKVLLDLLIRYFEEHLSSFKKPKSLEVLKEVFSN